ncbi:MAG: hypothetical protein EBT07_11930, partial [Actinobacteria bacterium]|nr:hypothetical protein [Actinomycetota bacterium]
ELTTDICAEVGACVGGIRVQTLKGKWQPSPRRVNKDTEDLVWKPAGCSREDHGACVTSLPVFSSQWWKHPSAAARGSGGAILARLERLGHHGCVRLSQRPPAPKTSRGGGGTHQRTDLFFLPQRWHPWLLWTWEIQFPIRMPLQKKIEPPKASGGRYQKQYSPTEWCCWERTCRPPKGGEPALRGGRKGRTRRAMREVGALVKIFFHLDIWTHRGGRRSEIASYPPYGRTNA